MADWNPYLRLRDQVTVTGTLADEVFCEQCGVLMDRRSNRSFLSYQRIREDG
jgi:hypothetical protein